MNVVQSNFSEALDLIQTLLPTASFMAIDEEMTGISLLDPDWSIAQSPEERYISMKKVATTYRIIQFGVCLFHKEVCILLSLLVYFVVVREMCWWQDHSIFSRFQPLE